MVTLIYIIAAVILLGFCIFIHELGHLLGGKMVGIKARVFSLGYGKGFFKKQIGDTTYQITLIPLGGYCQFYGDDPSKPSTGIPGEFFTAAPWKRIVTVLMGPLFNLFFGIVLFFIMNMVGYSKETNRVFIPDYFKKGELASVAYKAGIRDADEIVEINGKKITGFTDIQSTVLFSEGKVLNIEVKRKGEKKTFTVNPVKNEESGRFSIGIVPYGTRILIGSVLKGSVADKAGIEEMDEIKLVDGKSIQTPQELIVFLKDKANVPVSLDLLRRGKDVRITLKPQSFEILVLKNKKEDKEVFIDELFIDRAIKSSELRFNNVLISNREIITTFIKNNPAKPVVIEVNGKKVEGLASIKSRGAIGIIPAISPEMVHIKLGIGDAFTRSLIEPYEFIVMNLKGMAMLFSGDMKVRENLSGPIRIAKIAGDVAYYKGLAAFIILMAKISIILMVMNLLPIPVVDGSHIVFYTIEAIRGKPISTTVMEKIQTVGVIFLITLAVLIIINDISMLPFIQRFFE